MIVYAIVIMPSPYCEFLVPDLILRLSAIL